MGWRRALRDWLVGGDEFEGFDDVLEEVEEHYSEPDLWDELERDC